MGKGAYIRIQNKSTYDVNVELGKRRSVDNVGMDEIQGPIPAGAQLPDGGGEDKFGGAYQYIEGDNRFFFQKDGYFEFIVQVEGSSPSSLYLKVDNNDWWAEDKSPDVDSFVKVVSDVDEDDDQFRIEIRIYNNYQGASWMAQLAEHIEETPFCRVGLPGTHDSGTYQFDKEMGASPDNDLASTIQEKLDKGRLLGAVTDLILRNIFTRLCQCQDKSIKDQLEVGIRYLDLRVAYHEESAKYFTCHGVYCVDMKEVMQEINDFLTDNPKEIVVLDFNHLYEMDEHHAGLVDNVIATLGDKVADSREVQATSTVGEYWEKGYQAVILYCGKSCLPDYPGVLWSQGQIRSPWPNVIEADALREKLKEKIEDHDTNWFFVLQGLLTPDVELIKQEIFESGGISIKSIATRCSSKVVDWVDDEWKEQSLNIVVVDFFQHCSMVPAVINYNRK
jgi:hypothetical protein